MKIKTRLALLFTFITATLLFVFSVIIYFSAKVNREREFFDLLKKEAITKSNLYFDARVDANILQSIYRNNRQILQEVETAIYDTNFNLLYHDAVDIDIVKESPEMIREIEIKKEIRFYQNNWQVIGLVYSYQNAPYIVTAAAFDQHGFNKLDSLRRTILLVFVVSILFIYLAGRFFLYKAFSPIVNMTEKARTISVTNLDLRLPVSQNKDELTELAKTFNDMLERLENSFNAQKHLVSSMAHELRTPLSAIITELELSLGRERSNQEYRIAIKHALHDAKKLVRLSNSLLDLAKTNYDPSEISFKKVRIDEILIDARKQVQQANTDYTVEIEFENHGNFETELYLNGNEYLLRTGFVNLMENACKFSHNHLARVTIALRDQAIELKFSDNGIGISEDDLKHVFEPFYRGKNKTFTDGHGIGLYLTRKIIQLHGGSISVCSAVNKGTTFTVILPIAVA